MPPNRLLLVALSITGLLSLTGAARLDRGDATPYFDPVLSPGRGFCLPNGADSRSLLRVYQRLAKTELGPFPARPAGGGDAPYEAAEPPLFTNLGTVSFRAVAASPEAQAYFDQGLRLAYAFNHAEARRAFRMAQRLDPACALCYWGEALVLGPNINAPMEAAAQAPALAALARAQALAPAAPAKAQGLIAALARRYSADPQVERGALDAAYASAMAPLAEQYPDDDEIQLLYVEALMDLQPWDYWERAGTVPKGHTGIILGTLQRVLARNPDHPGAIHFYIHVTESSSEPGRAEPYARRLAAAMPGAGHLVHMPFHTFYRIGHYKEALAANAAAVEADEVYLRQVAPTGIYPQAYYPHNVHSLMVSAQMAGDGRSALQAAGKLSRVVSDAAARHIPWVQPIAAAPYFAHAQFSEPATILAVPDPGDALPFVKAMWHYARGVGYAAAGRFEAAQAEARAIARLRETADFGALVAGGVPAPDVLDLARRVVLARISQAQGRLEAARAEFEAAVVIEDRLAYSEPPYWYYPVRQSLGAVLLQMGRPAEAEQAFRESLARTPSNGWALYGLRRAYERMGRPRAAAEVDRLFRQAWSGPRAGPDLARL